MNKHTNPAAVSIPRRGDTQLGVGEAPRQANHAPGPYGALIERLERAAERGPQWIECDDCNGTGTVFTELGFDHSERCDECAGSGGYLTNPKLALDRMRRMAERECAEPILDLVTTPLGGDRYGVRA